MVQSKLVERFDTAVVPLMTEDEARECVARINGHMNSARAELLRLYEGRGWAALGYASWRECVVSEFEGSQRQLYRQLAAAEIERNLQPVLSDLTKSPIPEERLRPLAQLTPMEQPIAWQEANERTNGKPTARVVEEVVREMRSDLTVAEIARDIDDMLDLPLEPEEVTDLARKPTPMAVHFTSNSAEWYTPPEIIDRVVGVFGQIDLDPCSNSDDPELANVPALHYFTQETDGLTQPWHGRVYMNPPYGDAIGAWVERLVRAYRDEEIDEAIALLPARTDTVWFRPLWSFPVCFVYGRLRFSNAENSAPFPSAVVYLGPDRELFKDMFEDVGQIEVSLT